MTTETRRSVMDEFKQAVVALQESSGRPSTQIAAEPGSQPSMLKNGRRHLGGQGAPRPLSGRRRPPPMTS
jgi:transposase-like protein